MFFRNAVLFTFPQADALDPDTLEEALKECALKPLGGLDLSTRGFVPPMGKGTDALHVRNGDGLWMTIGGEDRILPPSAVDKALNARLEEYKTREGREPGSRARRQMRDEVLTDLIPRAFMKDYRCDVYINLRLRVVAVDTTSRKDAESAVSQIRAALGSFPALPLSAEADVSDLLTTIFRGQMPANLELGSHVTLKDPLGEAVIKADNEDLHCEDLRRHLDSGKRVARLGLSWIDQVGNDPKAPPQERVSMVFGDDLVMRKLAFLGAGESLEQMQTEDIVHELEARFFLFHTEFDALYSHVAPIFRITSAQPLFDGPARAVVEARLPPRITLRAEVIADRQQSLLG